MIQPQPAQRGQIGEQHGLQRLTAMLEALEQGQRTQETTATEIRTHLTTHAQELARLQMWGQRLVLAIAGLAALVLALGGAVGWQLTHRPDMAYARALGALDQTVVQQWNTMPKATQEALSATYTRLGLVPPGQRK